MKNSKHSPPHALHFNTSSLPAPFSQHTIRCRFVAWLCFVNTVVFLLLGHYYLQSILLSKALFQNTVVQLTDFSSKLLVILFAVINYSSYMMLLAFIPGILLIPLLLFVQNNCWFRLISILVMVLSIVLLFLDSLVFQLFKFHINQTIFSFIVNREALDLSFIEITLFITLIVIVMILETWVANYIWKAVHKPGSFRMEKIIGLSGLLGMMLCYGALVFTIGNGNNLLAQQTSNLPLFNQLLAHALFVPNARDILFRYSENNFAQPYFPNQRLNYPLHPMQCVSAKTPYNIIFIMVDSLRADALNKQTMPYTNQFAKKGWKFLQHLSGGNATQPGLFSLFYSIPSNYWTAALEQKIPPVFMSLLNTMGYSSHILWSSEMTTPPFDKTIYLGKPLEQHATKVFESSTVEHDQQITQKAIKFLQSRPSTPFFLNLFYNAPHAFCQDQHFTAPLKPTAEYCLRLGLNNNVDPLPWYNRYLNAVRFVDKEISQVLDTIETLGYLNNSIVLFTSDHGQEFNDNKHNYWGHASNFTNAQVQVPLVIVWPGKSPKRFYHLTTSYDVLPTLLRRLFSCKNPSSDYSVGYDLLDNTAYNNSFVLAGGYVNMGVIESDRITTLESSGNITVTDRAGGSQEALKANDQTLLAAFRLMRKYYQSHQF